MTKRRLPATQEELENMDPFREPYPEKEPLNPGEGYKPPKQEKPFNEDDQKNGDDFGREIIPNEIFK